jgi:hypothetical protein
MATTTSQMYYDTYQSTTYLQGWIGSFINSMVSVTGWLQTADTGQTAASGFTNLQYGNQSLGYQIYTFTDSLTATYPIYVKFEFGVGVTGGAPGMWITVGTGTNGSGTLTGQVSARLPLSDYYGSQGSSQFTSYFSGASNRFVCSLWESLNINWIISIERSKDSSGNDNTDGIILHVASRANGAYQQFIPSTGTVVQYIPFWVGAFSPYPTMAVNNLVGIAFPTPFNACPYNSGYNLAISNGTDIPMYNQVIGTIYGNSHNYLQLQYNNAIALVPAYNIGTLPNGSGGIAPYGNNGQYGLSLRPLIRYD